MCLQPQDLIIHNMALKSPDGKLSLEVVLYCIVLNRNTINNRVEK